MNEVIQKKIDQYGYQCNELFMLLSLENNLKNDPIQLEQLKNNLNWGSEINYTFKSDYLVQNRTEKRTTNLICLLLENNLYDLAELLLSQKTIIQIQDSFSYTNDNPWWQFTLNGNLKALNFLLEHKILPKDNRILDDAMNSLISGKQFLKNNTQEELFEVLCEIQSQTFLNSPTYHYLKKQQKNIAEANITWKSLMLSGQISSMSLSELGERALSYANGSLLAYMNKEYNFNLNKSQIEDLAKKGEIKSALEFMVSNNLSLVNWSGKNNLLNFTLEHIVEKISKAGDEDRTDLNESETKDLHIIYENLKDVVLNLLNYPQGEELFKDTKFKNYLYLITPSFKDKELLKFLNNNFSTGPNSDTMYQIFQNIGSKIKSFLPYLTQNNSSEINKFYGSCYGEMKFYESYGEDKSPIKFTEYKKIVQELKSNYPQNTNPTQKIFVDFIKHMSQNGIDGVEPYAQELQANLEKLYMAEKNKNSTEFKKPVL